MDGGGSRRGHGSSEAGERERLIVRSARRQMVGCDNMARRQGEGKGMERQSREEGGIPLIGNLHPGLGGSRSGQPPGSPCRAGIHLDPGDLRFFFAGGEGETGPGIDSR